MRITCLGSGDAYGSGGRFQTCYYVESNSFKILLDCGATALSAMKRFGVNPATIDMVLVTHLHGDHFGGIPFMLREAIMAGMRNRPLMVVGPEGIRKAICLSLEVLFPGSGTLKMPLSLSFHERSHPTAFQIGSLNISSYSTSHRKPAVSFAFRLENEGKIVAFSGDTEWVDSLLDAAYYADLFICETLTYKEQKIGHLSYLDIRKHFRKLRCKRILLTHVGEDLLDHIDEVDLEVAEDGKCWIL